MSDMCIRLAIDEGRIGLSKGKPFAKVNRLLVFLTHTTVIDYIIIIKLCKYVGSENCLCIESNDPEVQIQQVLQHFNIHIKEDDIFTRCQVSIG